MSKPIRILIVEDLASDFELAQLEIRKSVKECVFKQVDTRPSFLQALETFQPDVILSDYNLPRFDGLTALQLAKEQAPLTPFIIWTGSLSEDVAVECMKAGASNYVLKDNIKRLGSAIIHALEERRLLVDRKQAEEKYQDIFEHSQEGIFQSTPEGRFIKVNRAMAHIYGYDSPEDMIESITNIATQLYIKPEDRSEFTRLLQRDGQVEKFEMTNFRKDGSIIWTHTSARAVCDADGNILYYEGFLQDITERKQAEEALKEREKSTRILLDTIAEGVALNEIVYDENGEMVDYRILQVNQAFYTVANFKGQQVIGKLATELYGMTADFIKEFWKQHLQKDTTAYTEMVSPLNNRHFFIATSPFVDDTFVTTFFDITERKLSEQKVRESEERFRALIENSLDNISLLTADGTLLWENPAVNRTLGYEQGEFVNRNIFELIHPDDKGWTSDLFATVVREPGNQQRGTFRLKHQDGTWRWIEATATNMLNEPSVKAVVINYRDVTERKLSEIEIQQRNDDLQLINSINEAVNHGKDLREIVDFLGKELKRIFSSTGSTLYLLDPDGRTLTMQQFTISPETTRHIEKIIGSTIPLIQVTIQEGGLFHRVLISKRGFITSDRDEIQKWMTEFINTPFLPSAARQMIHKLIPQIYELLNIKSAIIIPLILNGKTIGVLDASSAELFTEDDLKRIENISGQLTAAIQRQQANEQVRRSEAFLQSIQNALSANIAILNEEGVIIQVNSAWRKFGEQNGLRHPESCIGLNYLEVCDSAEGPGSEEAKSVAKAIREVIAGHKREVQIEYPCHSPEEKRWFILRITKFEDKDQVWVVLAHTNITEQKHAEEALRASETKYHGIFDGVQDAIFVEDINGAILDVNQRACEIYGYTRAEFLTKNIIDLVPSQEYIIHLDDNEISATQTVETVNIRANGERFPVEIRGGLYTFDENKLLLVVLRDITERKQAEVALRESEERYRALFEDMPIAIWEEDFSDVKKELDTLKEQGIADLRAYFEAHPEAAIACGNKIRILDVNNTAVQMFQGENKEQLIQVTGQNISEGELENINDFLMAIAQGETSNSWEGADETFTDKPIEINLSWSVVPGYEHDYSRVIVTTIDITERKRTDDELRRSYSLLYTTFESTADGILVVAPDGKISNFNRKFLELWRIPYNLAAQKDDRLLLKYVLDQLKDPSAFIAQVEALYRSPEVVSFDEIVFLDGRVFERYSQPQRLGDNIIGRVWSFRDVTERKQAIAAMQEAETKYRNLVERLPVVVYTSELGANGTWTYVSPQIEKLLGFTPAEWLADSTLWYRQIHFEDRERQEKIEEQAWARGESFDSEYRIFTREGHAIWVRDIAQILPSPEGAPIVQGTLMNVTERIRAQEALRESEERLQLFFNQSLDGLFFSMLEEPKEWNDTVDKEAVLDYVMTRQHITEINDAMLDQYGGDRENFIGRTPSDFFAHDLAQAREFRRKLFDRGHLHHETEERRMDGVPIWIEGDYVCMYDGQGRITGIFGIQRDITERKRAETAEREQRALAEALRDTAETLNSTLDYGAVLDHILTAAGRVVPHDAATIMLINKGIAHVVRSQGYDEHGFRAEVMEIELPLTETVNLREMLETRRPVVVSDTQSYPGWKKLQTTEWLRSNVGAPISVYDEVVGFILLDSETPNYFTPVHAERLQAFANQAALAIHNARLLQQAQEEIDERKRAEVALRESEERFSNAFEYASIGMAVVSTDGHWLRVNRSLCQLVGYSEDELLQISFQDITHPEDLELDLMYVRQMLAGEIQSYQMEKRYIHKQGNILWILLSVSLVREEDDTPRYFISQIQDITERKRAEDELRASEERFRQLADNIQESFWMTDAVTGEEIYISPASEKIWGRPLESMLHSPDTYFESILPEDRPHVLEKIEEQRKGRKTDMEYRIARPDGSICWVWDRAFPIFDDSGRVVRLAGIAADVTERKVAEVVLRESESRLKEAETSARLGHWELDLQKNVLLWSDEIYRIFEVDPSRFGASYKAFLEIVHPDDREAVDRAYNESIRNKETYSIDHRLLFEDGRVKFVHEECKTDYDEQGNPIRSLGIVQDITERKQAEEALHTNEQRLRIALTGTNIAVFNQDMDLRYTWMYQPQLGYTSEKVVGKTDAELLPPQDALNIIEIKRRALVTGKPQRAEAAIHSPNKTHYFDLIVEPLLDNNGTIIGITGSTLDITDRKNSELETRRRADEFAALYETARDLASQYDLPTLLDTIVERANALLHAPGGGIYLYDPERGDLEMALALGTSVPTGTRLQMGEGMAGRVAQSRQLLIVDDYRNWDGRAPQFGNMPFRAIVEVPMLYGGELIGVLVVHEFGESERKFSEMDAHLLSLFAEYAASAVHAARLLQETRRSSDKTAALLETSLALTSLDLETNLKTIGNRAKTLFAGDGCRIFLLESDNETLRCVLALQEDAVALSNLRIKIGEGVTGTVAASGHSEIVNEMQDDPRAAKIPGTPDEEEAIMFAPLKERDRTIGVLSIRRIGTQRPFQPADLELLEAFASLAASAVSNARLFEETQRRLAELETLYENGLAVGSLLKPREIGERIIETFARYLSWHHVAIRLIQPGSDNLELIAFNQPGLSDEERSEVENHFNSKISRVGQGLSGWAVQISEPLRFGNVHAHAQYVDTHPGIQSGLYMPLKIGNNVLGVISVESEEPDAFTAQDERLLATLGSQAAVAFENARLYQTNQQERERFSELFENTPVATWLEDFTEVISWMNGLRAQGVTNLKEYLENNPEEYKVGVRLIRILDVNHAAVMMNGARNREELLEKVHALMMDETPSQIMISELELIWRGYTSFGFEMSSQKLDGSIITGIQRVYIPTKINEPDYERVIVTSTDITDRVNFENQLRASELHYRELADSITDIFFELDQDLRYSHWNKASEVLTGLPAEDAIGKSMRDVFGESDEQTRIEQIYRDVLEKHQSRTFETNLLLNDQPRDFEINAYPSTNGVAVVAKDVTERKRSESLMQKRFELMEYSNEHDLGELMQKTLDELSEWTHSTIGFFQLIKEDQITPIMQVWSTDTFKNFYSSAEAEMHKPADQAGVWAEAIRQRRAVIHNDYEAMPGKKGLPEGHAPLIRELVLPIIRNERIVAVVGVGNKLQEYNRDDLDITERFADYAWDIIERKQMVIEIAEERNQLAKRVEERTSDLSRANSNLARALRVKDEFLANMSHELRTPLNAILGLSESLSEQTAGPLNEKQQRYLTTISESGHHLLALINDILDLAKIEAGQITLDITKVDVNSVSQASLRMIKQLAQKKNLDVSVEIDETVGLMWADERRLKQMIVNLLSNAVKFTPEGGKIGLQIEGSQDDNKVTITVWDTGIGIKANDFERLFQPFIQLDSGLARESSGTGLGLALVAQMARLHGGSISVQSDPGKGSRFTMILPWEPALTPDSVERMKVTGKFRAIQPGQTQQTILLIEDTQEVVMMIKDYLEIAGYKVATAQDGLDGIAQARFTHPDLILMDVQMPRMDGLEATQKLRQEPEFKYTPIIALTALAMPSDRERCIAAGMDEYLSKPVNLRGLVKLIQSYLSFREEKTKPR